MKSGNKTMLESIANSISDLLKFISETLGIKADTLAYEAIKSSLNLVEETSKKSYSPKTNISSNDMISIINEVNSMKMTNFDVQVRNELESKLESKELKCS